MHVLWVMSNELNALQTCIWLKVDSIALQNICNMCVCGVSGSGSVFVSVIPVRQLSHTPVSQLSHR